MLAHTGKSQDRMIEQTTMTETQKHSCENATETKTLVPPDQDLLPQTVDPPQVDTPSP